METNYQILVNRSHPIGRDFLPNDLVDINEPTGYKEVEYQNKLVMKVYEAYKIMQEDAAKEGYYIYIDSSYRSYEYQEDLMNRFIKEKGLEYAKAYVAPPGTSEHQTGLCIDVLVKRGEKLIDETNEDDPEIQWLMSNSYKYGFILRYPKGYEDITGYNFEHWHYRYIGIEHATKMHDLYINTFEEYYDKYLK